MLIFWCWTVLHFKAFDDPGITVIDEMKSIIIIPYKIYLHPDDDLVMQLPIHRLLCAHN